MIEIMDSNKHMSKNRLETLVDGIFAIAMTLLVFDLPIPHFTGSLDANIFQNSIYSLIPIVIALVLSFILLAMFWNIHRRIFNQLNAINSTLLWINIIWLLFIVTVPFTTILYGEYGQFTLSKIIFNISMLGIAVFLYLNCYLINRSDLINEKADRARLKLSERASLLFILISLLAMLLAFIAPYWSTYAYILIFPSEMLIDKLSKKS
jgi:uncharacterized membrane protein